LVNVQLAKNGAKSFQAQKRRSETNPEAVLFQPCNSEEKRLKLKTRR
jgi:hypothetical protein